MKKDRKCKHARISFVRVQYSNNSALCEWVERCKLCNKVLRGFSDTYEIRQTTL